MERFREEHNHVLKGSGQYSHTKRWDSKKEQWPQRHKGRKGGVSFRDKRLSLA